LGPAEAPARLLAAGPDLAARLAALAKGAPVRTGPAARAAADRAEDEVFETVYPLSNGGSIAVETTRALTAVDVDLGGRGGDGGNRAAKAANLAALSEAARVLRLKGLGGLVVFDLIGRGHDGPALLAAARAAFAPDNPGVALGPVSRFGALELTIPRRSRPALDILADGSGGPSEPTRAMALLRALEREAMADAGARFEALAAPGIAAAAQPFLAQLTDRFGARLSLKGEPGLPGFEVRRL
ncbi:MAG: ribonuclease E/G, partial [Caulobacteraceae bacterium]